MHHFLCYCFVETIFKMKVITLFTKCTDTLTFYGVLLGPSRFFFQYFARKYEDENAKARFIFVDTKRRIMTL